jgi:hypothetical protein
MGSSKRAADLAEPRAVLERPYDVHGRVNEAPPISNLMGAARACRFRIDSLKAPASFRGGDVTDTRSRLTI